MGQMIMVRVIINIKNMMTMMKMMMMMMILVDGMGWDGMIGYV